MRMKPILAITLVAGLGLTACTDPYDPGQRAVGGGLLGAGAGAAIGALAGGGRGAAIGALVGGGVGAVGGAATTPTPPPQPTTSQRRPTISPRRRITLRHPATTGIDRSGRDWVPAISVRQTVPRARSVPA